MLLMGYLINYCPVVPSYVTHKCLSSTRCPVSGCANQVPLAKEDLIENKQMKKYIDKKNRAAGKKSSRK